MTESKMVGWLHQLNGHELEQALGAGEGQGSLVCCSSWDCRVKHHRVTRQQQGDKLGWLKEWANLIQITTLSTTMGKNPLEEME